MKNFEPVWSMYERDMCLAEPFRTQLEALYKSWGEFMSKLRSRIVNGGKNIGPKIMSARNVFNEMRADILRQHPIVIKIESLFQKYADEICKVTSKQEADKIISQQRLERDLMIKKALGDSK